MRLTPIAPPPAICDPKAWCSPSKNPRPTTCRTGEQRSSIKSRRSPSAHHATRRPHPQTPGRWRTRALPAAGTSRSTSGITCRQARHQPSSCSTRAAKVLAVERSVENGEFRFVGGHGAAHESQVSISGLKLGSFWCAFAVNSSNCCSAKSATSATPATNERSVSAELSAYALTSYTTT